MAEPITYKTTICVECTWPSNKYWEPMLKEQKIRQTNDWIKDFASISVNMLNELILCTNNTSEMTNAMNLRFFLEAYINDTGI